MHTFRILFKQADTAHSELRSFHLPLSLPERGFGHPIDPNWLLLDRAHVRMMIPVKKPYRYRTHLISLITRSREPERVYLRLGGTKKDTR